MPRLNIPQIAQRALVSFAQLNAEQYAELINALDQASPDLYQGNLVAFVQERVTLNSDLLRRIVRVLLELSSTRLRNSINIEAFVDDIIESLKTDFDEENKSPLPDWEQLKSRLSEALQYKQVIITAKAFAVMTEQGHIYCNQHARILTDIRPVFADDVDAAPSAAVIVHTLKVAYHEGEEIKDIYIALDSKDLHELRNLIDRADKKAEALRNVITNAKMQYLDPEVHEHSW